MIQIHCRKLSPLTQIQAQTVEDQAECQCPDVNLDPSRHGGETWMVPEHFDLPDDRYDRSEAYLK